ncbi:MAG TPA: DUF3429 domain-containing protein [Alphaproteobacteria bacterium]|nr:DUF3429 domain-containing protein [Alphaproteobacteria bacterium]
MSFDRVPAPALWLGLVGFVPFLATTVGLWVASDPRWSAFLFFVQLIYAAVTASFLGAVHWGLAMANLGWAGQWSPDPRRLNDAGGAAPRLEPITRQFLFGAVPAIVAWSVVVASQILRTGWVEIQLMMALFAVAYWGDREAVRTDLAPEWYLDLRRPLTIGVEAALALTLLRLL